MFRVFVRIIGLALALALWLAVGFAGAGCGVSDFFDDGVGTVYTCGDGKEEWCSRLSADEVSAIRDLECHATGVGDRLWPGLTNLAGHGCDFSCKPHAGCNAHSGCLCPGNGAP